MPPASRGSPVLVIPHRSPLLPRRNASSFIPPPPRNPPARIRAHRSPELTPEPLRPRHDAEHEPQNSRSQRTVSRRIMPRWLRQRPYVRSLVFSAMVTIPISAFIFMHFPFQCCRVTGPSMKPTFNPDCESDRDPNYRPTYVLVRNSKFDPNYRRNLDRRSSEKGTTATGTWMRGDIVLYSKPHNPEEIAVKRIVGVAGDLIIPLKGYPGGEEPVVVPYNHLWVEGDVGDRKKSVDSNYFGPISKAMVHGRVVAMWSPWWNIFGIHRVPLDTYDWPAKKQKRVVVDAVHDASAHPDTIESVKPFEGRRGDNLLKLIREHPQTVEERFRGNESDRSKIVQLYAHAYKIAKHHPNAEMQQRGREIGREFERIIGRNALREAAKPQRSRRRTRGELEEQSFDDTSTDVEQIFANAVAHEDQRASERDARATPAKAALEEMLKQKQQLAEMIDKEFQERDKIREAREL